MIVPERTILFVDPNPAALKEWELALNKVFPETTVLVFKHKIAEAFRDECLPDFKHIWITVLPDRAADGCVLDFFRIARLYQYPGIFMLTSRSEEHVARLVRNRGDCVVADKVQVPGAVRAALILRDALTLPSFATLSA